MSDNTTAAENKTANPGTKEYMKAENEALKAELEAMKVEKEALKNGLAVKPEAPAVPEDERVELFVEKGYANDEPNFIVSVNGVMYVLPRGKTSKVPKFVADEYRRSQKARQRLDETVDKMLAEASK